MCTHRSKLKGIISCLYGLKTFKYILDKHTHTDVDTNAMCQALSKYIETNLINKFNLLHNPLKAGTYYYAYFIYEDTVKML